MFADSVFTCIRIFTEALSEKKQEEKDSPVFLKMPSEHYMEVANLLLSQCVY